MNSGDGVPGQGGNYPGQNGPWNGPGQGSSDRYGVPDQPGGSGPYGADPTAQFPTYDPHQGYGQDQGYDPNQAYAPQQGGFPDASGYEYGAGAPYQHPLGAYGAPQPGDPGGGSKTGVIVGAAVAAVAVIGLVVGLLVWAPWKKDEDPKANGTGSSGATSSATTSSGTTSSRSSGSSGSSRSTTSSRSSSSNPSSGRGGAVLTDGYIDPTKIPSSTLSAAGLGSATRMDPPAAVDLAHAASTSGPHGSTVYLWTYRNEPPSYSLGTPVTSTTGVDNGNFWHRQYVSSSRICNVTYFSLGNGYLELWKSGNDETDACSGLEEAARAISPSLPI